MGKPISLFSFFSVLAHLAVLLLIALLLNTDQIAELQNRLPVFSYEVGDGIEQSELAETLEQSPSPAQTRTEVQQELQPNSNRAPAVTQVAESGSAGESSGEQTKKPSENHSVKSPRAVTEAAENPAPAVENSPIVTEGPSLVTVAVASKPKEDPSISLYPKQEKMLDKKLQSWSENFYRSNETEMTQTWSHKGQTYVANFSKLTPASDTAIEQVLVNISTQENGETLTTSVKMKRLAFSNFAQFVNRWDPNVQIHDDELDGRFHSNTEIFLGRTQDIMPTFHGKVSTSSRNVSYTDSRAARRRNEIFQGGLETGVRRIRLPSRRGFPAPRDLDEHRYLELEDDSRLVFTDDGFVDITAINGGGTIHQAIGEETFYIVAKKRTKLFVSGCVNGRVLVFSPERIIIESDLVYADDPESNRRSDDYLGLVALKTVEVAPPEVTGGGDLAIQGSIYAGARFVVKKYRDKNHGLLSIYGSLTAGSLTATEPRYATKIKFDQRLENARAPGFPMTNRYEVSDWDRAWRLQ